jgi:Putative prokaryotic signal transducing protein
MVEIVRTNDLVTLGFLQSLLESANVPVLVADAHISSLEGMIGAFQRRLLVPDDRAAQARRLIAEAGLSAELRPAP